MDRRHIAIVTELANGHVYSLLPVCTALVRRGYRVTYATNTHYESCVRLTGAEPVLFEGPPPGHKFEQWFNSCLGLPFDHPQWLSLPDDWISYLQASTRTLYSSVHARYCHDHPDLVLYDR